MARKYIVHVTYRTPTNGVTAATATPIETDTPRSVIEEEYERMARRMATTTIVNVEVVPV